ncbi:MAG TPA: TonB-dependent receptor [Puia sp.]|jgi:ferric enterobactin receptor|nr:TonB-dependent receptor [Puia sp.]
MATRQFITAFVLLFTSRCLHAQQPAEDGKGKITGRILDSSNHQAIEYATITVYATGNAHPVNGSSAGPKGVFSLGGLKPGSYKLTVEFIGYRSRSFGPLTLGAGPLSLGDILLSKTAEEMQSVTVTAPRGLVENKIDKLVFNAEKDITSQSGVATDVLKKVPMVSVDVDGNVELQGNANILFLINGRPSSIFGNNLADALQSIPASQIKSIEVITSPGAKYDAEGTGGIINIILKENRLKGINGNISATAGSRLENGSFNLNARQGNFGLNAFFSGNAQLPSTTQNSSTRNSFDSTQSLTTSLLQDGSSRFHRQGYESGLGFDWSVDPKNNLSGNIGYDNFGNNSRGSVQQQLLTYGQPTGTPITDFPSLIVSNNHFQAHSIDWNIRYKKTFATEDKELDISYDGSFGQNHSSYDQTQSAPAGDSVFAGSSGSNSGNDRESNFRLDFTDPLSEKVTLETGGRIQIRQITSVSPVYTLDPVANSYGYDTSLSNSLVYDRHVYAGYASLSFPLLRFLDVKGGLRYERTETDAGFSKSPNTVIPGYNTFAPSIILSHAFPNDQTLKISYSERIHRPDYRSLNPYVNASDPKNLTRGNPFLQPEVANNIDLTYSKSFDKGSALNIVLFYHRSDHDIQPFIIYYPSFALGDTIYTDVSVSTPMNVGSENNYGMNIFGSVPLGSKFNVRTNIFVFDRYITTGTLGGPPINSFNYRFNLNATYQLSPTFVLEFFGNFNSARNEIQGRYPSFTSYNFAFRKQIWNKKGSIAFSATNPFGNFVDQATEVGGAGFTLNSLRRIPYRSFGINFTWKFGKLEFKKDKDKEENKDLPAIPDNG